MKTKLAVLAVIVSLSSFSYSRAETDANTEAAENRELRREIAALKQQIADLKARLARLEDRVAKSPRAMSLPQRDPLRGSYLRFPVGVERAMMGDTTLPRRLKDKLGKGDPNPTLRPIPRLEQFDPPNND